MKTDHIASARPASHRAKSQPPSRRQDRDDKIERHASRRPSWLALGVGALGIASGLRPVGACYGLNPMHQGWLPPPDAWPSNITYGNILALLAASNHGPYCSSDYGDDVNFSEYLVNCADQVGVGCCASTGDFDLVNKVLGCFNYKQNPSFFDVNQPLRPIDTCGVLRAKDCIFFFPDGDIFQDIEDNFTRTFDPTCHGFNPQQPHWQGRGTPWPSPVTADTITSIANTCTTGPACGSALNSELRSFDCAGQAGTIIGQGDLDAAFNATQAACQGAWQVLPTPPQGDLVPYNQTQVQGAWDVGYFFTAQGSSNVDAQLLVAAKRELAVLQRRHDAEFMWRTALCSAAVGNLISILAYATARGSIPRKLGVGVGMGYLAGTTGVLLGTAMLEAPRRNVGAGLAAVAAPMVGVTFLTFAVVLV